MRLSEAIRLGSILRPQHYGSFYGRRVVVQRLKHFPWLHLAIEETSCALGAAYEATGGISRIKKTYHSGAVVTPFRGKSYTLTKDEDVWIIEPPKDWHPVFWRLVQCPACSFREQMTVVIPHVNDTHQWTRERIAAFVQEVEQEHESKQRKMRQAIARDNHNREAELFRLTP